MSASAVGNIVAPKSRFVQCPQCEQKLPLRSTGPEHETAAVWKCAACDASVVGFCEQALLVRNPHSLLLDERYFDVAAVPEIDSAQRRRVCSLTGPPPTKLELDRRRSTRVIQSLVAPAIALTPNLMPQGQPFRAMVANLSREGIGLVHPGRLESEYLALQLRAQEGSPIQVVVHVVRHLQLEEPYFEIGGEFYLRLGSIVAS